MDHEENIVPLKGHNQQQNVSHKVELQTASVTVAMGKFSTINGKGNYFPGAATIVCSFSIRFAYLI